MTGEIYAKVLTSKEEKAQIHYAIKIMENVRDAYASTGVSSAEFLIDDLNDGISALKGVLEELYY